MPRLLRITFLPLLYIPNQISVIFEHRRNFRRCILWFYVSPLYLYGPLSIHAISPAKKSGQYISRLGLIFSYTGLFCGQIASEKNRCSVPDFFRLRCLFAAIFDAIMGTQGGVFLICPLLCWRHGLFARRRNDGYFVQKAETAPTYHAAHDAKQSKKTAQDVSSFVTLTKLLLWTPCI